MESSMKTRFQVIANDSRVVGDYDNRVDADNAAFHYGRGGSDPVRVCEYIVHDDAMLGDE